MNKMDSASANFNQSTVHGDEDIFIEKNQNGVETYVFDPYNPLNVQIDKNEIKGAINSIVELERLLPRTPVQPLNSAIREPNN